MLFVSAPAVNNKPWEEKMFSKGFIYRWGIRIKNLGDRAGHKRVFGVFVFGWLSVPIRGIGFRLKG